MKRVFIVHGWDGHPQEGWFPWLKTELEKRGFAVTVPAMPNPAKPTIAEWVPALAAAVGKPDSQTYFVGHSMGVITVLKYLETLTDSVCVGGVVSVAGFLEKPINISVEDDAIAEPWFTEKLSAQTRVRAGKVFAIFSPTDKWVRIENKKLFEEQFGAQTFIDDGKGDKGHFSGSDGVTELPKVLELLLEMSAAPLISIDDVVKLEIKMGKIVTAEKVDGSDKLLKFSVDFGGEVRTIVSGVAKAYAPEQMVGKMVPVITNLAPRKLKGIESQGMIIYAIDETADPQTGIPGHLPIMLNPEKEVPPGSLVQ